jgi:hypothetical protein
MMNRQQQAARTRAIAALQQIIGATQAGSDVSAIALEPFVDAVIEAATPGLSEHAEAMQDEINRKRS